MTAPTPTLFPFSASPAHPFDHRRDKLPYMRHKLILLVRSMLPLMMPTSTRSCCRGSAGCRLCDLQRLRLAAIGESDIHSSVGLSSAVNKFSSGCTIRQSVKRPMSLQTGTVAINVIAELPELMILFRLAWIRPGLREAFASPRGRGEASAAHPGS